MYSKEAPPPVEIQENLSARPSFLAAAAESPPPIKVNAPCRLAIVSPTSSVPFSKFLNSVTPIGPFHTTVFAPANSF